MKTFFEQIESKIEDFGEQLKSLLSSFLEVRSPQQLLTAEQEVQTLFQHQAGQMLSVAFEVMLEKPDLKQAAIEAMRSKGGLWKSKGRRTVRIRLENGSVIEVTTPYYVRIRRDKRGKKRCKRGAKGGGCYPVLEALGIRERITPAALEKLSRFVAVCSSLEESRQQLAKMGFDFEIKTIRTLAWHFGDMAVEAQLSRLAHWLGGLVEEEQPLKGKRVVVTLDGGRVRLRIPKKRGRRKKNGRRSFEAAWREPRVLCIYLIDEKGKKVVEAESCWYDAVIEEADDCFDTLLGHLKGLGLQEAKQIVFTADGANWIWNRIDELWHKLQIGADNVVEVVDFYHAADYLHEVSQLRTSWSQQKRKAWFEKARRWLRKGKVEQVLESIRALATGRNSQKYMKKMGYFERHLERMRYEQFKAAHLPIGSGAVESAVRRIINQRIKGPGILWLENSAQYMLLMRAYLKAGRWDELVNMIFPNESCLQELA